MATRRGTLACALLAATVMSLGQGATYELRWKPKQGQQFSYKMLMRSSLMGQAMSVSSDVSLKVLKVTPEGDYTVESRFHNGKLTIAGKTEAIEDDAPEVQTMKANGEVVGDKQDDDADPVGYLLGQVADFKQPEKPVGIGAKWTRTAKAKGKMPGSTSVYEMIGLSTIGDLKVYKVGYRFAQTEGDKPTTATGFFYLDQRDCSMVRFEADIKNMVLDPESPPAMATMMLTRQD